MAMKERVTKVWIEPGCIVCDACETSAPTVFEVTDDTCIIRPAALDASFTKPLTDEIKEAAEECPVDVIKFETVAEEVADASPTEEMPAAAEPVAAAASAAPAVAATAPAAAKPAAAKPSHAKAAAAAPEPSKAKPEKAPEKAPTVSMAGEPDPAIQALLRAATARGGMAMIGKSDEGATQAMKELENASPADMPPDARQAKVFAAAKDEKGGVTRRGVLAGSAAGVGWLAFGGASAVSGIAFQRFMMPNVLEEPDPRVRTDKVEVFGSMVPGEVNEDYKPQGFWIIRMEDRIAVLNIICTHLGCIPNWLPNDRKFKCPCHGSGFRPSGINFEGPAPRPLERFRVTKTDGIMIVDRSKKYQYEKGEWENPESYIEV